ncbi:MAG: GNAT family N-acetyltransferase [Oscillospiraceae bacterium]|nr:GNAT family N-acetyltransferase [Oscillospiraceae bacterium]
MEIKRLDYQAYQGKTYRAAVRSSRYLSIEPDEAGFSLCWKQGETERELSDQMLSDWLEDPAAYGAFRDGVLLGFAEGFLEKWNNRFRITNICVFEEASRHSGIGTALLNAIMQDAAESGARMAVLETQSYNEKAISFYEKNGFELIGFDRYAYSNDGPAERNMRIEMGKKLK